MNETKQSRLLRQKKEYEKAFYNHKVNGIHLSFPNGNSLSTIWGIGSYSENHDKGFEELYDIDNFTKMYNTQMGSDNCEVMPGCSDLVKKLLDATFPEEENGSIFGNMTFEKWLKMVNILNENK